MAVQTVHLLFTPINAPIQWLIAEKGASLQSEQPSIFNTPELIIKERLIITSIIYSEIVVIPHCMKNITLMVLLSNAFSEIVDVISLQIDDPPAYINKLLTKSLKGNNNNNVATLKQNHYLSEALNIFNSIKSNGAIMKAYIDNKCDEESLEIYDYYIYIKTKIEIDLCYNNIKTLECINTNSCATIYIPSNDFLLLCANIASCFQFTLDIVISDAGFDCGDIITSKEEYIQSVQGWDSIKLYNALGGNIIWLLHICYGLLSKLAMVMALFLLVVLEMFEKVESHIGYHIEQRLLICVRVKTDGGYGYGSEDDGYGFL